MLEAQHPGGSVRDRELRGGRGVGVDCQRERLAGSDTVDETGRARHRALANERDRGLAIGDRHEEHAIAPARSARRGSPE